MLSNSVTGWEQPLRSITSTGMRCGDGFQIGAAWAVQLLQSVDWSSNLLHYAPPQGDLRGVCSWLTHISTTYVETLFNNDTEYISFCLIKFSETVFVYEHSHY